MVKASERIGELGDRQSSHRNRFRPEVVPVADHPAVVAWRRLGRAHRLPHQVEVLLKRGRLPPTRKSRVFRLRGAGPAGLSVIAKRSLCESVAKESVIYQSILPEAPVPVLRCYGSVDDAAEGMAWLFLQEARGERYRVELPAHRELAATWLAAVHSATSSMSLADLLPEHGPQRYAPLLHNGRTTILECLDNPALQGGDVEFLGRLAEQLERVESRWAELESLYTAMPRCLVHADVVGKNLRVGESSSGPSLWVMDWDVSGWGAPAVDIERVDLEAYAEGVRRTWPELAPDEFRLMAAVGAILRNVGLIAATSGGLRFDWPQRSLRGLRSYAREMSNAMRGALSDVV